MKNKQLTPLSLVRLNNRDCASLFQLTINVVDKKKEAFNEMGAIAYLQFKTDANPFIEQVNRFRESAFTPDIDKLRKTGNNLIGEIKRTVVFHSKSRTESHKAAAQQIDFFFKPYWGCTECPIGTHIKDITELDNKYRGNAPLIAQAKLIGIHSLLNELDENNKKLTELYIKRNSEMAQKGVSGTDLRPAATDAYIQFCQVAEQAVNLMPSDAMISLFNEIDTLRLKSHSLLSKPKNPDKESDNADAVK